MTHKSKKILSEISPGELLDKISILEIKLEKVKDKNSLEEIKKEHKILKEIQTSSIDITGKDGKKLADKWSDGPRSFLGISIEGFPNMFTITGPGSPSVLGNMIVAIEQHVEWVAQCINDMESSGKTEIEADIVAEDDWMDHIRLG